VGLGVEAGLLGLGQRLDEAVIGVEEAVARGGADPVQQLDVQ
jgi:hypothetical protein